MNIFSSLTAGDSARWNDDAITDSLGRRMTSADWMLTYRLRGPFALSIVAQPDGDGWQTVLTATASADLLPGAYSWAAILTKEDERVTIGSGSCEIKQDLSAADAALDVRTVAKKALEDCEKALATFNSTGGKVKKYTIGPREMEFQTLADLMQLLNYWKLRVNHEVAADSVANGRGNPSTLLVRF